MNTKTHNQSVNRKMRPAWLERLLSETNFFSGCEIHKNEKKNENNVFCVDCHVAICQHCIPRHHHVNESNLLQIRRYVYHDVIRLQDIEKLIDCAFVQPYIINSAKVVFLNPRPPSRPSKPGSGGGINSCRSCDRSLQEKFRFCCLACKVDSYTKGGENNLQKILMPAINANHPSNGYSNYESSLDHALISTLAAHPSPNPPSLDDFNRSPTFDQLSPHSVIFFPHDSLSPSNSCSNTSMSNSHSSSKSLINLPKSARPRSHLIGSADASLKSRHNLVKCRSNAIDSADRLIKSRRFAIKSRDAFLKPRANSMMNSRADHLKFHSGSGELSRETPKFMPTLSSNRPSLIKSAVSLPIIAKRRILSPSSSSSSSSFSQIIGSSSDHSDYNIMSDHSFRKRSRKGEPMRSHLS